MLEILQDYVTMIKKLVRRVEPTKQCTRSQHKYAPEAKQVKIKGVKYPMNSLIIGVASEI